MDDGEALVLGIWKGLRMAARSATMRHGASTRISPMVAVRKVRDITPDDDSVFDDADALIALAQKSFTAAAKAAVAENDRLGIPTPGSVHGKLVMRQPPKTRTHA